MGDSYGFSKVRRDKFMNGKSRFIMDSSGWGVEDYNPDYIDIVGDLDREDFLYRLVKPNPGELDGDVELTNYLKNTYASMEEQAIVVTPESVKRALDVLVGLDKKVSQMPFDENGEAGVCMKQCYMPVKGKSDCFEDKPSEYEGQPPYLYFGSCKENIAIYKEVEKVYGSRAYHYVFPWEKSERRKGASYVIESLFRVVDEMTKPENKDYVFLFTWI